MTERATVRLGISVLLLASTAGALVVSLHTTKATIPNFAFASHVVLAVQLALLFFYAGLLLLVPLLRAFFDGDLPIELGVRGARWTEDIRDLGSKVSDRQARAAESELRADLAVAEEMQVLRDELEAKSRTQEDETEDIVRRVTALEKQIKTEE
jgi:hypothetical protein